MAPIRCRAAHTDYAANCGDAGQPWDIPGPPDLATGDSWTATKKWLPPNTQFDDVKTFSGICYLRSEIRTAHITDGATNTYLIGEKYLNPDDYFTGADPGDDQTLYGGFDNDNHRTAISPPRQDTPGARDEYIFGTPMPRAARSPSATARSTTSATRSTRKPTAASATEPTD